MVIVVMGIVASIGAEIIAKLYENYLQTRSINRLQSQTELVLDQISKRLTYRIKDSVIARLPMYPITTDPLPLSNTGVNSSYRILEWIGKDNEGLDGYWNGSTNVPGWSGFIDLDSNETNKTQVKTIGSSLAFEKNIINALSYSKINIDSTSAPHAVLIFKGKSDYNVNKYGWKGNGINDTNYTYQVQRQGKDVLKFLLGRKATTVYEQYDLAWTAYAIVPEGNNTNDFNLTLKYNFQPWDGDDYNSATTKSSLLMEHVSSFKFLQSGETIRLKLCIRDDRTGGDFGFCKEKVVF